MEHNKHHSALQKVAQAFFSFDRWLSAASIGDGNINETYRIDFQENNITQSRVLQRLNTRIFTNPQGVMDNIVALADYQAQQADYPLHILRPLAAKNGDWLHRDAEGGYWRCFPFFAGTFTPERLPDSTQAYEAARAYGLFLRSLRAFPAGQLHETIAGFHDTDRRWALFIDVLEKNPAHRASQAQQEIAALFEAKNIFDRVSRLKQSGALPLRVTHNDAKAGNVLLHAHTGKAVAVIDLDTVMPGALLSDIGDMVRTFTPSAYEDLDPQSGTDIYPRTDVMQALYEGFLEPMRDVLTDTERQHLQLGAPWIVGEQALRFLTDYLAGDVYYKVAHPEHNLFRARNQLQLLHRLRPVTPTARRRKK